MSKKGKPFFYRVVAAEFAIAVMQIPNGEHEKWLKQMAMDLVTGVGFLDYSKHLIKEVEGYREKQSELGRKGAEIKKKNKQATLKRPLSDPKATHKPETEAVTKEEPMPVFVVPEWMPSKEWADFVTHRKQIKSPMTELAMKATVNKLDKFRTAGHDIAAILTDSIANGWQGVFPPKGKVQYIPKPDEVNF